MSTVFHSSRRLHPRRIALATGLAAVLATGASLAAPACGGPSVSAAGSQFASLSDEHLKHLVHHVMERVDEAGRARITAIAMRARPEFELLEQRARQARAPRREALLADVIDRQALERIRAEEMRIAGERSRRVDQLLVDLAGVLTPQQRAGFLAELKTATP